MLQIPNTRCSGRSFSHHRMRDKFSVIVFAASPIDAVAN
jgi:hypothetical protein